MASVGCWCCGCTFTDNNVHWGSLCFQRKGLKGQGHWASDNKLLQKADVVDNRNHNSLTSLALPLCLWSQFFFASPSQSLIGQRIGECHYELWHISKLSWIDSNPARLLSLCVHFRFCPVPICAKTYFFKDPTNNSPVGVRVKFRRTRSKNCHWGK